MLFERTRLRTWIALLGVAAAAATVCCAPLMAAQPPTAPSEHCTPGEAPQDAEAPLSQCCFLLAAEMKHPVQIAPAAHALSVAVLPDLEERETGLSAARLPGAITFSPPARERLTQHICVLLI